MSKIIVECKVPAANACGDVSIPYEKPLKHSFELIKALYDEDVNFSPDELTFLCDTHTGAIHDLSKTPEELGLVNGSSLMLV